MNWKRATIAIAAILPLVALLGFGMTRDPKEIPSPLPGREAPEFALAVMPMAPLADGTEPPLTDTVRLSERRGRIQVVNYYASWCLACRDEHPILTELAPAYRERGVDFYGILYKDTPRAMRRWIAEMGGQSYPALLDPTTRTAIDYGLYGVPETFFIGPDGRVVKKHIGPVTRAVLVGTLDSLIASGVGHPAAGGGRDFPADTVVLR